MYGTGGFLNRKGHMRYSGYPHTTHLQDMRRLERFNPNIGDAGGSKGLCDGPPSPWPHRDEGNSRGHFTLIA